MESPYGPPLRKALGEEMDLDSTLVLPPEIANIDDMKSLNIPNEGLSRETNKKCSLEAKIHNEKAKESTREDLQSIERKEVAYNSGVSRGISVPLSSTTTPQLKAQKEPEFCPDEWQAQSDTIAQPPSVDTPHQIAKFVPVLQKEPKSREEEWLCHWGNLRSRVALDFSRYAALFEEIECERVLRPEEVDEELGTWIGRMDEQIRQSKELKLEMEALEEEYWELDWLVKEKICPTEVEFDGKREVEVDSESDFSGEGSIPHTRESKVSAQSSTPSPTPPLGKTASAKNQPKFCFKEWNVLFENFRFRTAFLVSRSHALDQEINLIEPQSRTVDQLRSWIALMDEIIKERDILKEGIVLYGEKVEERLRGLDVESSRRRGYEEALSRRIDGLKRILQFYEEEDVQRLEEEVEIKTRMNEVSELAVSNTSNLIAPKCLYPDSPQTSLRTQPTKEITHNPPSDPNQWTRKTSNDSPFPHQSAPDPIDIALAETESSIIALLSTYRKAEISSLNSTLTAQPSPAQSDACSSKEPAFLAAADETKRALEDYVRTMKEEEELRAMREVRGAIGSFTRDLYENSSAAKENKAIATGGHERIPLDDEENRPTTPTGAKVLIADEDEAIDARRLKCASTARETPQHKALLPLAIPLVYIFLTLLVRGLFWIFHFFLMAEAERERNNPPRVVEVVHPCDMNWDSDFCPGW